MELNDNLEDSRVVKIEPIEGGEGVKTKKPRKPRTMTDAALKGLEKARKAHKAKLVAEKPTRERMALVKKLTTDIAFDIVKDELEKTEIVNEKGVKTIVEDLEVFIKNVFVKEDRNITMDTPASKEVIQQKSDSVQFEGSYVEKVKDDNLTQKQMDNVLLEKDDYIKPVLEFAERNYSNDGIVFV
jgi:hypothetical protein